MTAAVEQDGIEDRDDADRLPGLLMRLGFTLSDLPITEPELHRQLHDRHLSAEEIEVLRRGLRKRGLLESAC